MRCFFYGNSGRKTNERRKSSGYISFTIPDIGISFKAAYGGKPQECEYTGLLALLEFIDLNPQLFKGKSLEIYSDSTSVVHQVNLKQNASRDLEPYRNMALSYQKKIPFTLNWIPPDDNPAQSLFTIN